MTSEPKNLKESARGVYSQETAADGDQPGWAKGLKQLYDSVVEEPLPDNFKDLLSKLDSQD